MKSKANLLLSLLAVSFCVACQDKVHEVVELKGKPVLMDSVYTGLWPVMIHENILFSRTGSREYGYIANSLTNDRLGASRNVFRLGNGHDEFHNVAIAEGQDSSMELIDYAGFGNKLLSLTVIENAKSMDSVSDPKAWKRYPLTNTPAARCIFESFVPVSDAKVLIPGSPYHDIAHVLSVVDFKAQTLVPLDYWPDDGVKGDDLAKHSVYTDNCRIFGNNENRYLYKCGEERFAFIFSIDNQKVCIDKELYSVFPKYECENGNYSLNRSGKSMYMDANPENIYALLLDNKIVGNALISAGDTVEVFDWEGNLIRTLQLDRKGGIIKVDKENQILYLFSNNPETGEQEIRMYSL